MKIKIIFLLFLVGCGTHPGKKSESLEAVSPDKVYPNLEAVIKNAPVSSPITFRESNFTFDWRDTLMNSQYGRVPVKVIHFDLPKIIETSKAKRPDKFRHLEVKTGKYLTLCTIFSPSDKNAVSVVIPEVYWLNKKNKIQPLPILQFNRNATAGMNGCLVSTVLLPNDFGENSKIVIHPKRFDSFVKPVASFQTETTVMAGSIFIPIKGIIQVLPSVIGDLRIEISDEKKHSEGAALIEDLY